MPSHGILYFVYLAVIWIGHWPLRHSASGRCLWFLAASMVFYAAWNLQHLAYLGVVIIVSYTGGLGVQRARAKIANDDQTRTRTKVGLDTQTIAVSVLVCLTPLIYFKYGGFLMESWSGIASWLFKADVEIADPHAAWGLESWLIPIGISFYTFQAVGYLIDVYRRQIPADRNLLRHAAFLAFFPQLVAGPIEQARKLSPQLWRPAPTRKGDVAEAFQLISIGLFKKAVLADNAAATVRSTLAHPASALAVYCGAFALMAQLYFDIAAYTDIARGSARLFGVELSPNLRAPFLARSCSEFWSRWHLSVAQWFRSYVFRPLIARRNRFFSNGPILMLTMVVIGLWHGASWNFVLFGGFHGLWVWLETFLRKFKTSKSGIVWSKANSNKTSSEKISIVFHFNNWLQWLVFVHILALSGLAFFADDLPHVWRIVGVLLQGAWTLSSVSSLDLAVVAMLWAVALWFQCYEKSDDHKLPIWEWSTPLRAMIYCIALLLYVCVGNFDSNDFVYMRF